MTALGILLMFTGAVLPFLIVIKVLKSTFFLNFLSYICLVTGLVIGYTVIAQYIGPRR
jgi:hypothetical protein